MAGFVRGLVAGELALGVAAIAWAFWSDADIAYRVDVETGLLALGLTTALAVLNFGLFFVGRRFEFTRDVYSFFDDEIFPMLRQTTWVDIVILAALAGFAEELLFRGLLQPRMGLIASSLLFGLLHGPEYKLWPLAIWAAAVGAGLGLVYRETDNIALPMLVHGLYDGLALAYVRWVNPKPGGIP
jgi:membrane protease YdiL (CAAX protease family)